MSTARSKPTPAQEDATTPTRTEIKPNNGVLGWLLLCFAAMTYVGTSGHVELPMPRIVCLFVFGMPTLFLAYTLGVHGIFRLASQVVSASVNFLASFARGMSK